TVMESMSCGTPCVAFNIGGIPDMIDHVSNGYLAKAFDINDLSHGIEWTLNSNFDDRLSTSARSKVLQHYDINIVSKTYSRLYKELLHNN
ncbi:glycosyltransferase, partial [Desulfoluna spongiiphila]|uniref:glycosyltransferase n=1 Tax=Desulfoluna spongiiphila TaxID=419481 RepID=UPI001113F7B3